MSRTRPTESGRRVLRVWMALKGHTLTGLSNGEIAAATGESPATVTRALMTLMDESLVTRLDSGRYAHSIGTLQIAEAHHIHMSRMRGRMSEIDQRVAAGSLD